MPSQANSTVDLAPDVLAALKHYEIRSRLSSDHTGQVFEAWDKQLCRTVVIRQIQHLGAAEEEVIKQARLAASLKHAAFAKIHALEEAGDSLLIVTEAVNGTSLSQWIASHAGVEKRILDHIANIATALLEAHQMGLVHGDLQASQFIVDQSGKIRILNCGFVSSSASYMLGSLDQINARGGIAYLAPERFSNAPASPAADVYALGCLLYEMLNGSLPFAHLQGLAMVAALVQSDPEQWLWSAKLTPAARKLMLAMCQRQPEQRINCAQVLEECRAMRANDPYSGSVGSLSLAALQAQLAKAQRRQHFYKLSAAVLALVLLAGMSWQFKPYWPQIVKTLTPYSESREIERGIAALSKYDKPGMLDQASGHFMTVLERSPDNALAVAYLSIGYSYRFRSGSRDDVWREKALASAQQAMRLNSNLAMTQVAYALALDPHNEFDIAMAAIQKAKAMESRNLIVWQTEVRILLLARKYALTIQTSDEALKLFQNDWLLLNLKGVAYLNQAQYQSAEQQFRQSVEHHPDVILSYGFLSSVLELQNRPSESRQVLQLGLQVRPDQMLYRRLGQSQFRQGDFKAAAEVLEKAVSANPQEYENWHSFADALIQIGKNEDATSAYKKARDLLKVRLDRRPNDGWFTALMAVFVARLGDTSRAQELTKRALELAPENPNVRILVASVYELLGRRQDALASIQIARKLGISDSDILTEPIFKDLRQDPRFLTEG